MHNWCLTDCAVGQPQRFQQYGLIELMRRTALLLYCNYVLPDDILWALRREAVGDDCNIDHYCGQAFPIESSSWDCSTGRTCPALSYHTIWTWPSVSQQYLHCWLCPGHMYHMTSNLGFYLQSVLPASSSWTNADKPCPFWLSLFISLVSFAITFALILALALSVNITDFVLGPDYCLGFCHSLSEALSLPVASLHGGIQTDIIIHNISTAGAWWTVLEIDSRYYYLQPDLLSWLHITTL